MYQLLKRFIFAFGGYLVFVFLFILAAKLFQASSIFFGFDKVVLDLFVSFRQEWLTDLMGFITFFGSIEFVLLATLLLLLLFSLKHEKIFSLMLMGSIGVSGFLVFELKEVFLRERPLGIASVEESDFSFPSGHAMMAIAFWGFLAYFLAKRVKSRLWKIFTVTIVVILAFAISISRVYLGVHWPTDILGSWMLGGVWLAELIWLSERQMKELI